MDTVFSCISKILIESQNKSGTDSRIFGEIGFRMNINSPPLVTSTINFTILQDEKENIKIGSQILHAKRINYYLFD